IQQQRRRDLALNIQVPNLHISEFVVLIDGEVVRHRSRGSWEPIFEGEYLGNRAYVRFGESEWRLKSQVLHNASVLAGVVINSVSAANNGFLHRPPRESHAWSEVVAIRFDDGDRECPGKCSRAAGKH